MSSSKILEVADSIEKMRVGENPFDISGPKRFSNVVLLELFVKLPCVQLLEEANPNATPRELLHEWGDIDDNKTIARTIRGTICHE